MSARTLRRTFARTLTVAAVMAIVSSPVRANAAWNSNKSSVAGAYAMATLSHNFVPIKVGTLIGGSGGTGGTAYQSNWVGLIASAYIDLTNTSSVETTLNGTVLASLDAGVAVLPSVRVFSCPVAWNTTLGTCSQTSTAITAAVSVNQSLTVPWGTLAAGATGHYLVTVGLALANVRFNATATETPTRAGMDRSAA